MYVLGLEFESGSSKKQKKKGETQSMKVVRQKFAVGGLDQSLLDWGSVCMCVYVYMYVYIYVRVSVCIYVCVYVLYACMYIYVCVCV